MPSLLTIRKVTALLSCLSVVVVLSACAQLQKTEAPACPNVLIPEDSSKVVIFKEGPGRDLTDVKVQAEFEGFVGSCAYDVDDQMLEMRLSPLVLVSRGPASDNSSFSIDYFVAMATPEGEILNKQVFEASFVLPGGLARGRVRDEEVELFVRLADLFEGPDYTVYLGFQLTREQLDYNRQSIN